MLESRTLLSVNLLPGISGTVFHDLTNNGLTADDPRLAGVTVKLYKDNGTGQFDASVDQLVATTFTNTNGKYSFSNLAAGTYFVQQLPAPGLALGSGQNVATVQITSADVQGVQGTPIDTFSDTTQSISVSRLGGKTATSSMAAPEAIGGYRNLYTQLTSSVGNLSLSANDDVPDVLDFSSGPAAYGTFQVTWDGSSASTLNPTGLNHADLTGSGANQGIQFLLGADHAGASLILKVYSDASDWSQATVAVPNTGNGSATGVESIAFSAFSVGGGSGANFSNVGAVQLELGMQGVSAVDGEVGPIATIGPKVVVENFANVTQADLVLVKSAAPNPVVAGTNLTYTLTTTNNGPSGATGVTVTDVLPAGVSYVSATSSQGGTPTFANGTFTADLGGLADGASATTTVIVSVNSNTTGSITNTAVVGGNEPDPNMANNTSTVITNVNSEADLAIVKSATPSPVDAGKQLTYTLTATNNGPSDATGVTVTDALPAGVSYVSATSSQGGTPTFANGTLTADLGGLADGASATTTLIVSVNSNTTGPISNTAVVSGNQPDPNLANNTSTVTTPVTPEADLAITKTASVKEVTAGHSFSYTLIAQNNGPSDATGVTIVDTLPNGLTLDSVSAAQGGYTISGSTVTINVGSLADGATDTITIQVTAAAKAFGTVTNTATVSGAQDDPDLSNNHSSVDVLIDPAQIAPPPPSNPLPSKWWFLG